MKWQQRLALERDTGEVGRKRFEWFMRLIPRACAWAGDQEAFILITGRGLSGEQMEDARRAGVARPDRVRVLAMGRIPVPEDPALRAAFSAVRLVTPPAPALALRYGIYLRADHMDDRLALVHELVHTAQCERLGGFPPFLKSYFMECLAVGHPYAPMEQEARSVANNICI